MKFDRRSATSAAKPSVNFKRDCFPNYTQLLNCKKSVGNLLVAKRTTQCASMGCPVQVWVARSIYGSHLAALGVLVCKPEYQIASCVGHILILTIIIKHSYGLHALELRLSCINPSMTWYRWHCANLLHINWIIYGFVQNCNKSIANALELTSLALSHRRGD